MHSLLFTRACARTLTHIHTRSLTHTHTHMRAHTHTHGTGETLHMSEQEKWPLWIDESACISHNSDRHTTK